MKAKFVYENINFERGMSPKKAMGVGLRSRFPDLNLFIEMHIEAKAEKKFQTSEIYWDADEPNFKIHSQKLRHFDIVAGQPVMEYEEYTFYLTRHEGIWGFFDNNGAEFSITNLQEFKFLTDPEQSEDEKQEIIEHGQIENDKRKNLGR